MSSWPSSSEKVGITSTPSSTSDPPIAHHGRRASRRPQRDHRPVPGSLARPRARPGSRRASIRGPISDSRAGSRVIAASTAVTTATADAYPSEVTSGIPATARHSRAITTVPPANTIALPEVASVRAIDSSISVPSRIWLRCRLTRNSA